MRRKRSVIGVALILFSVICVYTSYKLSVTVSETRCFTAHVTEEPKKKSPIRHDRWIIVESGENSVKSLTKMNDVPGWRILIYGNGVRGDTLHRCKNCIFIDDWSTMPQYKNFGIKDPHLLASLYAIGNGAKWIYPTRDGTDLVHQLSGYKFDPQTKGLLYRGKDIFDADAHFGFKARPFKSTDQSLYQAAFWTTPSIQTKWRTPSSLGAKAVSRACTFPTAVVPADKYPLGDVWGHLIGHESFWILRILADSLGTSVMTGWVKKLLSVLDENIGILPPSCSKMSKVFSSVVKPHKIVLQQMTRCQPNEAFYTCALNVLRELESARAESSSEAKLTLLWFNSLGELNYHQPTLNDQIEETRLYKRVDVPLKVWYEASIESESALQESPFRNVCRSESRSKREHTRNDDVALIVIFNKPFFYKNIRFTNYMFRQYFTNIIYCGHRLHTFMEFRKAFQHPVTFLEVEEVRYGIFFHMCAVQATKLGYNVNGYLTIGDDVLLNMWNLVHLPRDKFWFQSSIRNASLEKKWVPNITKANTVSHWWPWGDGRWGVNGLRFLWGKFDRMKSTMYKTDVEKFLFQINSNFGGINGAFYQASDIFYVPQKFADAFTFFAMLLYEEHTFAEIAVPTIFMGLDSISNLVRLPGTYLWYGDRSEFLKSYNPKHAFLHSWKITNLASNDTEAKRFFCENYLPYVEGRKVV